jgi:hypothetical protein
MVPDRPDARTMSPDIVFAFARATAPIDTSPGGP